MYAGWTEAGPRGAVYDISKSGWFDGRTFNRWFFEIFLPHAQELQGRKVIISDNLGSHFSPDVIQATLDHNISFITLLPNATHLLQPLDVAVFRGLKRSCRLIIDGWRKETRFKGCIPKPQFPSLLARLCTAIQEKESLVSGFRGTGILPFDPEQVLKRLPGAASKDPGGEETMSVLNESVLNVLQQNCGIGVEPRQRVQNRRGPKIIPGKRIVELPEKAASNNNGGEAGEEPGSSVVRGKGKQKAKKQSQQQKRSLEVESDEEEQWVCADCMIEWESNGDDRWIVCDNCNDPYHLQCCGLQYSVAEYYEINIEVLSFICNNCTDGESDEPESLLI